MEGSSEAQGDAVGDGDYAERGLSEPATLDEVVGLAKVIAQVVADAGEAGTLTDEHKAYISSYLQAVFPDAQQTVLLTHVIKAVLQYLFNDGDVDQLLATLKRFFCAEPSADEEESKEKENEKDEDTEDGDSEAEEDSESGEGQVTVTPCTIWVPLRNMALASILPYKVHVCTAMDTLESLAEDAGCSEDEFVSETYGSGIKNQRRFRNRATPQDGDVVMLPNEGAKKVELTAKVNGALDGMAVKFHIYRQYREHEDPLETLEGETENELARVKWDYEYDAETYGERPQFIYKIETDAQGLTLLQTASRSVGVPSDWGPALNVPSIVAVKWSKDEADLGEEVGIDVYTEGMPDQTPITIEIYQREKGSDVDPNADPANQDGGGGPSPDQDPDAEKHTFEAIFYDAEGGPLTGIDYVLTLPDGSKVEGSLDSDGRMFHDELTIGGNCTVAFKELE